MEVHLRLLRYFVAVADELNMTHAAQRLHIAQPSLSKQIRQLETELGIALFTREPRGVLLTPAGQALLEPARRLLHDWAGATAAVRAAADLGDAVLRLGFTAATTNELLPPILRTFTGRRPGWRIRMVQMSWADPAGLLRDGDIDVALVRHPVPDADRLVHVPIHTEPRILALPADHHLAGRSAVAFADLLDEVFVPLPHGPWRDYWLCVDRRGGRAPRLAETAHGPEEWSAAISAGHGVAVTAESTSRHYARPGIVYRPLIDVDPTTVSVARRRDDHRPAVLDFLDACATVSGPT